MLTEYPTKFYPDFESLKQANSVMSEFQVLRNILRHDYINLLKITEQYTNNQIEFNAMYRACLVQLFTIIEADLYGVGTLDPYPKENTQRNFISIFRNTFTQAAKTWGKEEIYENYIKTYFDELMKIKKERNHLTHPKKIEKVILPAIADLDRLKKAFENYNNFIGEFMKGFFIGCRTANYEQLQELKEQSELRGLTLKEIIIKHTLVLPIS